MKTAFLFLISFILVSSINSQITWTKLPGPQIGNVKELVINSSGTMFIGNGAVDNINGTGLFRSTNNGINFSRIFTSDINSLTIDKISNTMYMGCVSGGVKKSTNNGLNWANIGFSGLTVKKVVYSQNTLYALVGTGLHKTTDGGSNWSQLFVFPSTLLSFSIDSSSNLIAGTNSNGIYRSTNGGVNWINTLGSIPVYCIYSSTGVIYAGSSRNNIYRSMNNGASWDSISVPFRDIYALTIDGANKMYGATDLGIYTSLNMGANWSLSSQIYDGNTFGYDLNNNVILNSQYGLYRTTDGGTSWNCLGIFFAYIKDVEITPDGKIYVCSDGIPPGESLLWVSTDIGNTWSRILKTSIALMNIEVSASGKIYIGSPSGTLLTTNNGLNWENIGPSNKIINRLKMNSNFVFVCTNNGFYKTSNDGINWISCGPLVSEYKTLIIDQSNTVFTANDNPNSSPMYIWKSSNDGDNWINVGNPAGSLYGIYSLASDFAGNVYAAITYYIYRTSNSGASWTQSEMIGSPYFMMCSPENHLYISISSPWRSTNYGANFVQLPGIGGSRNIVFHPSNIAIVGTEGSGVFKSSILTLIENQNTDAENYLLLNNYPNPFNPNTSIRFSISTAGDNYRQVKLLIYDINGEIVEQLLDTKLKNGKYEILWNAEKYSSAVYFCKLIADNEYKTRKLILLK